MTGFVDPNLDEDYVDPNLDPDYVPDVGELAKPLWARLVYPRLRFFGPAAADDPAVWACLVETGHVREVGERYGRPLYEFTAWGRALALAQQPRTWGGQVTEPGAWRRPETEWIA